MSVGKNRHYGVDDVVPRHFVQTAASAGVGLSIMRSLFEELAATAVRRADSVAHALPDSFPDQLVASITAAIARRARLLEGVYFDA